jgi:hypothetical protein
MDSVRPEAKSPTQTETISNKGQIACIIVRAQAVPEQTTFYTPAQLDLQVGKVIYPAGIEIPRHSHRPTIRHLASTAEVLVVQSGHMVLDLYDDRHIPICSRELTAGDVVVLLSGGHGFRMLEDSVLIEVKQGPYFGSQEKELF